MKNSPEVLFEKTLGKEELLWELEKKKKFGENLLNLAKSLDEEIWRRFNIKTSYGRIEGGKNEEERIKNEGLEEIAGIIRNKPKLFEIQREELIGRSPEEIGELLQEMVGEIGELIIFLSLNSLGEIRALRAPVYEDVHGIDIILVGRELKIIGAIQVVVGKKNLEEKQKNVFQQNLNGGVSLSLPQTQKIVNQGQGKVPLVLLKIEPNDLNIKWRMKIVHEIESGKGEIQEILKGIYQEVREIILESINKMVEELKNKMDALEKEKRRKIGRREEIKKISKQITNISNVMKGLKILKEFLEAS